MPSGDELELLDALAHGEHVGGGAVECVVHGVGGQAQADGRFLARQAEESDVGHDLALEVGETPEAGRDVDELPVDAGAGKVPVEIAEHLEDGVDVVALMGLGRHGHRPFQFLAPQVHCTADRENVISDAGWSGW